MNSYDDDRSYGSNDNRRGENTSFLSFSKIYFDFLNKGKYFSLIYFIEAIICLSIPFVVLYLVVEAGFFNWGARAVFGFILVWIVILLAGWIGFQLWWDRRKKLRHIDTTDFIAIPIVADMVKTTGECWGTMVGLVGTLGGLIVMIFFGNELELLSMLGLNFINFWFIVLCPIVSLSFIMITRYYAEWIILLATLTSNTKEIAMNVKERKYVVCQ